MTQLNLNINMDELTEAIMSSDLSAMMKTLTVAVFNAYMETERDDYIQSAPYERTDGRTDYRNGYYQRDYTLPIGKLRLTIPRTRSGEFSTQLFDKYSRVDKSFVLAMMEAVINGVSTRKVTNIVETLCGDSVSHSFVSKTLDQLDPEIQAFQQRSLTDRTYNYVYVDAMYIKVHEESRVVSKAVYIALGVNEENKREVIGFKVSETESEAEWKQFFQELRHRGLNDPKLIISDAHQGIKAAVRELFAGQTAWQRCTVHFIRNIIQHLPKKDEHYREAKELIKSLLRSSSFQRAKELKDQLETLVGHRSTYQKALECLDDGFWDALQYVNEPSLYHISLRTTNTLERLNQEVRRREKVIRIFPNIDSAERLIGALLINQHEQWSKQNNTFLGNRSGNMQSF